MQYQNKKFSDVSDDNFNKLNSLTLYKDTVAFEFKNGWTDLVYNLGKDIEDLCKLTNCELPLIQQIKEKFGTLCFYYNTLNSQYPVIVEKSIRALVFQAEIKSSNTCEVCGKYGEVRVDGGIYTTVCEEHKGNSISKNEYEEMVKKHHEKRALEKGKKMQLSKYTQENDKVLTVIDRKMIFKIDDNFFIDDEGIKSFTEKNIENIVPLKLNQEVHYAKKYIKRCTRSENGIISLDFKEDIYNFLKGKEYDEEECYVSNGSFLVACYLMSVPVNHTEDIFAEVFLEKPLKEYVIKPTKNKTFFGLEIHQDKLIKIDDIKKLPFYDLWYESSKGSTQPLIDNEEYVYLSDFESFSKLFIETGKHRFQKRD